MLTVTKEEVCESWVGGLFCFESPPRPPREVPGRGAGGAAAGEGELARAVLQDALTEVHENEVWPKGTAASDTHEYPVCPTGMSGAASCMGGVWVIALTRGAVGVLGPLLDQRARAGMAGGEISGGTETLDAEAGRGEGRAWVQPGMQGMTGRGGVRFRSELGPPTDS
jgi:hypothetical protein